MMQVEVCKVIPSCFEAETNDGPVSVLANGSSFLFFIISENVVKSPFYNAADLSLTAPHRSQSSFMTLLLCFM